MIMGMPLTLGRNASLASTGRELVLAGERCFKVAMACHRLEHREDGSTPDGESWQRPYRSVCAALWRLVAEASLIAISGSRALSIPALFTHPSNGRPGRFRGVAGWGVSGMSGVSAGSR